MRAPMRGRRANLPGSTQNADSFGLRHSDAGVFRRRPFDGLRVATRLFAQGGRRTQRVGVWDLISSFPQAASRSRVRSASAHGVLSQRSASLPRRRPVTSRNLGRHVLCGSVNICEVKKAWAGDEPARSTKRGHPVSRSGSYLASPVLVGDPGQADRSSSV